MPGWLRDPVNRWIDAHPAGEMLRTCNTASPACASGARSTGEIHSADARCGKCVILARFESTSSRGRAMKKRTNLACAFLAVAATVLAQSSLADQSGASTRPIVLKAAHL